MAMAFSESRASVDIRTGPGRLEVDPLKRLQGTANSADRDHTTRKPGS